MRLGILGIAKRRFRGENRLNALGRHHSAGEHHRHECSHHHAKENLGDVLHEGDDCADLDLSVVHADGSKPEDGSRRHIQNQHDDGKEEDKGGADIAPDHHDVGVGDQEPCSFNLFPHKGANYAYTS